MLHSNCLAVRNAPKSSTVKLETNSQKSDRLIKKLEKYKERFQRITAKKNLKNGEAGVDFEDPVDKWMWFWIFGWGASIAISILAGILGIGFLGFIGYAAGLFGTVSLIIWIIKKFG